MIGLINTAYYIGAIVFGWFVAGPTVNGNLGAPQLSYLLLMHIKQADYFGRRIAMGSGCLLVIAGALVQTFTPYHNTGVFILGRVLLGCAQGLTTSTFLS
jgi:MFS family permease